MTLIGETIIEATALARRAVEIAEDKLASDIVMLDLQKLNSVADYFVICTGESERQLKAILDAIDEGLGKEFERNARVEGPARLLSSRTSLEQGDPGRGRPMRDTIYEQQQEHTLPSVCSRRGAW
jgi:ribosome silencing factor RsfS/YbeB/iojap